MSSIFHHSKGWSWLEAALLLVNGNIPNLFSLYYFTVLLFFYIVSCSHYQNGMELAQVTILGAYSE